MNIELGKKAKDRITGLTGIVTARVEYLGAGNRIQIQPPCKPDGEFVDAEWIDEERVEAAD